MVHNIFVCFFFTKFFFDSIFIYRWNRFKWLFKMDESHFAYKSVNSKSSNDGINTTSVTLCVCSIVYYVINGDDGIFIFLIWNYLFTKEHRMIFGAYFRVHTYICRDWWKSSWTAYSNQLKHSNSLSILFNNINDIDNDKRIKKKKSITKYIFFLCILWWNKQSHKGTTVTVRIENGKPRVWHQPLGRVGGLLVYVCMSRQWI